MGIVKSKWVLTKMVYVIEKIVRKVAFPLIPLVGLVLLLCQVSVSAQDDDDDLLLLLPAIIAGSLAECDTNHLGKCKAKSECESAGGHWFLGVCDDTPPPAELELLLGFVGTWDFYYQDGRSNPPKNVHVVYRLDERNIRAPDEYFDSYYAWGEEILHNGVSVDRGILFTEPPQSGYLRGAMLGDDIYDENDNLILSLETEVFIAKFIDQRNLDGMHTFFDEEGEPTVDREREIKGTKR